MWSRGLRPNAPARPVTVSAKPALALARDNGAPAGVDAGMEAVLHVNGSGPGRAENGVTRTRGETATSNEEAGLGQRMALVEIALTAVVTRVDRLVHMETALTALAEHLATLRRDMTSMAEQIATQHQSQASLERHVANLGKVLGQLGLEIDDRLTLVELVLDDLGATAGDRGRREAEAARTPTEDVGNGVIPASATAESIVGQQARSDSPTPPAGEASLPDPDFA